MTTTPCRASRRLNFLAIAMLAAMTATVVAVPVDDADAGRWWDDAVEAAIDRSGDHAPAWREQLAGVPAAHHAGVTFLLAHMPERDLRSVSPALVIENVALAYAARDAVPWGVAIPDAIFLNDVLPYANVNETREPWRRDFYERFLPVVADCTTPAEAAQRLNEEVFGALGVKYSTKRKKADQSPSESIEIGMASCTGLSIILADACRAVAVPARLAGIPRWPNKSGNHTWVEVWDGEWHFTGAAEPDARGLDHAWFAGDAALADPGVPEHAIYAASYRPTDVRFPLVWAPDVDWVHAVNVSERYKPADHGDDAGARLMVRVVDRATGERIATDVRVMASGDGDDVLVAEGESRDESADNNDLLTFDVEPSRRYVVEAIRPGERAYVRVKLGADERQSIVDLALGVRTPPRTIEQLAATDDATKLLKQTLAVRLRESPETVRAIVWELYRGAVSDTAAEYDFEANRVRYRDHESPYVVRMVGERPEGGWPLFIAMHGGGGAPQELNDQQWKVMETYYRDHPDVGGYLYLALGAPNNTWNGFYDDYVYPLVANLIRQFLVFGDVDPDRVFLMGYSHGGYGAFAIGPKMPDRFAAIHCSAAAPTDGESSPVTLRNTVFTYMIGENDHAHGRADRCRAFDEAINALRGDRTDIYPVTMEWKPEHGHRGLPDRDKIATMYAAVRNPLPRELTWAMTDGVIRDFYWLSVDEAAKGFQIDATCADNVVKLRTTGVRRVWLNLDHRLVDTRHPLIVDANGRKETHELSPSVDELFRSMAERGDPELASTVRIAVDLEP